MGSITWKKSTKPNPSNKSTETQESNPSLISLPHATNIKPLISIPNPETYRQSQENQPLHSQSGVALNPFKPVRLYCIIPQRNKPLKIKPPSQTHTASQHPSLIHRSPTPFNNQPTYPSPPPPKTPPPKTPPLPTHLFSIIQSLAATSPPEKVF